MKDLTDFCMDWERERRLGFPEIIFGQGKSREQLKEGVGAFLAKNREVLVTRLEREERLFLKEHFTQLKEDIRARACFYVQEGRKPSLGPAYILTAGSSDAFVAHEARLVLEFLKVQVECFMDVGVAGIDRILKLRDRLSQARVVVVVAGFEGALASVVGGIYGGPVVAVPTSVGYGVCEGGKAALHAMLASCANGITVVNIDSGYSAALAAYRILNFSVRRKI